MGMKQRELLVAVDPVLGVVDVEHPRGPAAPARGQAAPRHVGEAVAEQLDHRRHHPLERPRPGQVLEPADGVGLRGPHTPQQGRLRAQIGAALGQAAERQLEGGIGPQRVAIIGVGPRVRLRRPEDRVRRQRSAGPETSRRADGSPVARPSPVLRLRGAAMKKSRTWPAASSPAAMTIAGTGKARTATTALPGGLPCWWLCSVAMQPLCIQPTRYHAASRAPHQGKRCRGRCVRDSEAAVGKRLDAYASGDVKSCVSGRRGWRGPGCGSRG
jgi:hypothetical protein